MFFLKLTEAQMNHVVNLLDLELKTNGIKSLNVVVDLYNALQNSPRSEQDLVELGEKYLIEFNDTGIIP